MAALAAPNLFRTVTGPRRPPTPNPSPAKPALLRMPTAPTEVPEFFRHPATVPPSFQWLAVQTLSRREKLVADWLAATAELDFFLPLLARLSPANRTTYTSPLLPGFCFAAFSPENKVHLSLLEHLRRTPFVFGFLRADSPGGALQESFRRDILALTSETPSTRTARLELPSKALAGQRVRVREGPFAGLEGFTETAPTNKTASALPGEICAPDRVRLYIRLHLLGQPLSLEISPSNLEVL